MNHNCPSEVGANHNKISCLAFQLWEKAGSPEGRDLEFWLAAETQLLAPQRPDAVKAETLVAKGSCKNNFRLKGCVSTISGGALSPLRVA
ncbi:MAG: DUF2934 domain-containing protein [Limisphaerales bacterium]